MKNYFRKSASIFKLTLFLYLICNITASSFAQNGEPEINCDETPFVEKDGILVVEIESVNVSSGWSKGSTVAGFTGSAYYQYTGSNKFNAPGSGLLQYKIYITNPGTYHFRWHNKIMVGTSNTDSNDSWLRIPDADDFFAKRNTSIKYPKGGKFVQSKTITEGSSSGGWMKVYCSGTTSWTWSCRTSDSDAHEIYATFSKAGVYTVQISARSNGHAVDRFVLFKDSNYSVSQATNKALNETRCINTAAGKVNINHDQINIYPNPARDFLVINNINADEIVRLKVIDLTGKTVVDANTSIPRGSSYNLTLAASMQNGLYLLNTTTRSGEYAVKKFMLKAN